MHVRTQVRVVFWSVAAAALLLAADVALTVLAQRQFAAMTPRMMSPQSMRQVEADYINNLLVGAAGAIIVAVLVPFVQRHTNRVRVALWVIGPLLGLALLCSLVGGPEWAVAPTGEEPELLRREYAQAVPGWYLALHGTTGLCAAALMFFVAGFVTRTDLREYYQDAPTGDGPYRSWVDRTGG